MVAVHQWALKESKPNWASDFALSNKKDVYWCVWMKTLITQCFF